MGKTYPAHSTYDLDHQLIVRSENPDTEMELLALQPGMVVGDIGCGSGFYTTRFVQAVGPTGRVHAIDIQPAAIDYLQGRIKNEGIDPHGVVRLQLSRVDATLLEPGSLDAALLSHADFYAFPEMLPENVRMIADLYRTLKPAGALVVVQKMDILPDLLLVHGDSGPEVIERNFSAAGFVLEQQRGDPRVEVYLRFRKPPG